MPTVPLLSQSLIRLMTVVFGAFWAAASQAAQPGAPHGYVEPCAVHFVETSETECELCPVATDDDATCVRNLRALGYQKKCRTGGHSPPAEVWCIAKPRKPSFWQALSRPYVWIPLGITALTALALFLRRQCR